ncbi:ABC transporter permease [Candidatus Woesearchaeota archaeon]|nr:ABC transporter permease [Candidatus Woesearchaeota archaeon]
MKVYTIFKKNLKVIARSKTSAFAVVFGPLLVVLLISLAFNKPSVYELNVGLTVVNKDSQSAEALNLSTRLKQDLESNSYSVLEFDTSQECVNAIKQGIIHTCIVFPENFSTLQGNRNLDFFVDYSRTNLVWAVIEVVGKNIDLQASQLSMQYASELLNTLQSIKSVAENQSLEIVSLKTKISNVKQKLEQQASKLSSIDLNTVSIDLESVKQDLEDLLSEANSMKSSIISKADSILNNGNASAAHSTAQSIKSVVNDYVEGLESDVNSVKQDIDDASETVNGLNEKLSNAKISVQEVVTELNNVKQSLSNAYNELSSIQTSLEAIIDKVNNLRVKSAETISNPITTTIKTVVSENSQLLFMAPYLVMLLVMFVGLLLSGTIIVMEKQSKAFFRNFTTPTREDVFLFSNYLTSLFLLLLQIIVIIGVGYYFLDGNLLNNWQESLVLILLASSLFILLGMALGYLFPTQEGVTIGSLSLGSLFLLISNLVLPLETISGSMKTIANYNPYVIASELFRKLLFFDIEFQSIAKQLGVLLVYSIIILFLLLIAHKFSLSWYLYRLAYKPSKKKFELNTKQGVITNSEELLNFVNNQSQQEFKKFATEHAYELQVLCKESLKNKKLARAFKKLDKAMVVKVLKASINKRESNDAKKEKEKTRKAKGKEKEG